MNWLGVFIDRFKKPMGFDHNLPPISGSFFGKSDGSEQDDDLAFVFMARAAIGEGKTVYYDS